MPKESQAGKLKEELQIGDLPWVGQSPDINQIENLWSMLKRRLALRPAFASRPDLISAITEI